VRVPILGSDRVLGAIILESFERENAFGDAEVRLLSTVAASMGVALENARLFDETQRLFKESEQRAAELAIINSVQEGLAAQLDFQAIVDLVGDKIREIFGTQRMSIALYDRPTGLVTMPYYLEHGDRFPVDAAPLGKGLTAHVVKNRQPLVINESLMQRAAELGSRMIGDTSSGASVPLSYAGVPILKGDEAVGVVALYGDRENAFADSDVRLLSTLANAMTVALENARLFDETQRLFKAEQQRAAELAIITSVQHALAAELNMQGIYDAVGDKIREIFHNADLESGSTIRRATWSTSPTSTRTDSGSRSIPVRWVAKVSRPTFCARARHSSSTRTWLRRSRDSAASRCPARRTRSRRCTYRWSPATMRAGSSA
jgi:GAF domain-containing protein